ncbi:hypothetical protein AAK894_01490 [Lachnospiraceae bacterium 46-61]
MKHKKVFVFIIILIAISSIIASFVINHYAKYLGEQATEVTSDLLLKMLQYYVISDVLCSFAVILFCLLVSVFAYQKIKSYYKKG